MSRKREKAQLFLFFRKRGIEGDEEDEEEEQ